MIQLKNGFIFAADWLAGTIWKIGVNTWSIRKWLSDTSLAPLTAHEIYRPGANGSKLRSDGFIISNTSRGTLSLIEIENFKKWVKGLASQVSNLNVNIREVVTADSVLFETKPDGVPILSTLISIIVIESGKITHNWLEKSALELCQRIIKQKVNGIRYCND